MIDYINMMHVKYGFGQNIFPGFGIFIQFLLFVIFIAIIYWIMNSGKFTSQNAEDILKKRLAKGEITIKEYNELKKEISK